MVEPKLVTGLDGKSYAASRPARTRAHAMPSLESDRGRQVAAKAKERVEKAVGICNGLARGLKELHIEAAMAAASQDEIAGWIRAAPGLPLRAAVSASKRLRARDVGF
jgi:hypothetical protein